jgi:hypothetical protein
MRDYKHAITFAQTLEGVDVRRIGVGGTTLRSLDHYAKYAPAPSSNALRPLRC